MSVKKHTSFLGVTVTGDITKPERRQPQRPLAELAPIIQAVIDDSEIVRFGWQQYTPYFNDGDTCTFGTYAPYFFTAEDRRKAVATDAENGYEEYSEWWYEELDEDDYEVGRSYSPHPSIGHVAGDRIYSGSWEWESNPQAGEFTGPDRARYDRCLALSEAIEGGAFDDVLLEHFGDHASIVFTRGDDGVMTAHVEVYSHD